MKTVAMDTPSGALCADGRAYPRALAGKSIFDTHVIFDMLVNIDTNDKNGVK
ncbi:MAG TPA: hypothetical protein VGC69_18785 [Bordetella sp.]